MSSSPSTRRKVVTLVAEYPHSLMTGGLQVQATRTLEALRQYEPRFDYRPFDWTAPEKSDLYHFISLPRYLFDLARLVEFAGKPYVCTLLLGERSDFSRWWRDRLKRSLGQPSYSQVLGKAAAVIAITGQQRQSIVHSYAVPAKKTLAIPHGVDEIFFETSDSLWKQQRGDKPFLLCVGAIQPRKNQLLLLEAANAAQVGVVLIGPVLPGKNTYASLVRQAVEINRQWGGDWIPGLPHDDPLLASAYAACRGFVLLSHHETQPISALQALAAGKPLLLADAAYAHQPPFRDSPRVSIHHRDAIRESLRQLRETDTPARLESSFHWQGIAHMLADLYEKILGE